MNLTLLKLVPKACIMNLHDATIIHNHCCVFEDFYVHSGNGKSQSNKTISLDILFSGQKEKLGELYYIIGYRVTWKYLTLSTKRAEMSLKPHVLHSAKQRLDKLLPAAKKIAIHLRIGDASNHVYNFPGPEYFYKAMQYFRSKWKKVKFLIMSDNPKWCKQQSLFDTKDTFVMDSIGRVEGIIAHWLSPPKEDWVMRNDDFTIMSACDGVIASVGTFAWWSGRLSFQNGGEVIYFKNSYNLTRIHEVGEISKEEDFFPPEWIGISAKALDHHGRVVQDLKGDIISETQ